MIAIVISITVILSVLMSAFISFAPNLTALMENDYMRRANNNAISYSLQYGQLGWRAGWLVPAPGNPNSHNEGLPLRAKSEDNVVWDTDIQLTCQINITDTNQVDVTITKQHTPPE